jgi:hypothetical protein
VLDGVLDGVTGGRHSGPISALPQVMISKSLSIQIASPKFTIKFPTLPPQVVPDTVTGTPFGSLLIYVIQLILYFLRNIITVF